MKASNFLKELLLKGQIVIVLVRAISFIFCFSLGSLSIYVFSVAAMYFARAGGKPTGEKLSNLFSAIGLIAVAVVVLDLALTIYREMVTAEGDKRDPARVRGSLTRFITIVIIAVLIEGIVMLFRFSEAEKVHLLPYTSIVFGVALILIIGLAWYLKISISAEKLIEREKGENIS